VAALVVGLAEFQTVDYRRFLECALTETKMPIFKLANLKETPACINGIAKLGANLVSRSNIHILALWGEGLESLNAVLSMGWIGLG
jgi:hypothetical protein